MIKIVNKQDCCGCTACEQVCHKNAITMQPDEEGFLYPVVDNLLCVDCGVCENVCPVKHTKRINDGKLFCFAAQNKNEKIKFESTSGGIFSFLAVPVLRNDGIVYGVSFNETWKVVHSSVTTEADLKKFRGSKYVQSYLGNTFRKIKQELKDGCQVLFSGTPCQVEGLLNFLKTPYANLKTVDIVCHGVPSPGLFEKYIEWICRKYGTISAIRFRDKSSFGYRSSSMRIDFQNRKIYKGFQETDPMLKTFFSGLCSRPSCFDCRFKKLHRRSDYTIFDGWHIAKWDKTMDDNKGTTLVITKDASFINNNSLKAVEVDLNDPYFIKDAVMLFHNDKENSKRHALLTDLDKLDLDDIVRKYCPVTFKDYLKKSLRPVMYKLGIMETVKYMRRLVKYNN
jgi:NAD-dependent dihydropyrimidine dehydrogenase PreA subunit